MQKANHLIGFSLVDHSFEISNFDFIPRNFEITIQTIHLIQKD